MLDSLKLLYPEIFLSGAAMLLLGVEAFVKKNLRRWVLILGCGSLFFAMVLVLSLPTGNRAFGLLAIDNFSLFFKFLAILSCLLILCISENDTELMGDHAGAYVSLLILSTVGMLFLSSAEDLLMLFIGMELTTIPLFILAGFLRKELRSSESAIKFFLVGAFSTGLMLYGISYIYGLCGSTHFRVIFAWTQSQNVSNNALFLLGLFLILVGIGFKLSLAPFHQWTPDTYEGAPTPITAFFSASREAGVIVVALRLFSQTVDPGALGIQHTLILISILTMTLGNLIALKQENLKRLLAYSSIAHAGTLFIGLVANNSLGREGVMIYSLAYFLMSFGAFAVVILISRIKKSESLSALRGLSKENLGLSILMLFFLLSLAGIPPFLGFLGKWMVFASAIQAKLYWLVGIALLNSVVAVYYYFRMAHAMFFQDPDPSQSAIPEKLESLSFKLTTLFAALVLLILGIFPGQILSWIRISGAPLP
ncbi:MAG: NADH-quinone oxidoreductase subunit N [Elusimicrobia bacterium]|nr:NADH-quinone oxidoreductase subunit N [Elusimicrobiota bacterium]